MINTRAIHFRLILWYSGLITAVLIAFGAYVYRGVELRLYADAKQILDRRAYQIATDILPRIVTDPPAVVTEEIHDIYSPETTDRFIRISRLDGTIFYVSGSSGNGKFDPQQVPTAASKSAGDRIELLRSGSGLLIVTVPARIGHDTYFVEMGMLTDELKRTLDRLLTTLLIGLPLVVITVSAGGYVLVRRSLKPVEQLRATAQQLTFGTGGRRLPVANTGDDIEHLAVTLNQMLERLHESYQQVSRFSADASHELRTPLTIMRGELESIIRADARLPKRVSEHLISVLEEVERLSHITESLFSLSRFDAGEAKMQEVPVELDGLVRSTVDQMRLLADEKLISLILQIEETAVVRGDPARLKQVIIGLLDNALKYTPHGGQITLKVYVADRQAVFEVSDTGIGIAADALPHVLERFYRADKARSRQIDGAGLGLSIAHSICQAHGGTIEVLSVEGCGTTCRVTLPLAA